MSQIEKPLFGAIEAGGTKFVVAVGTSPDNVVATSSFPTSDPTTTIRTVMDFFQANAPEGLSGIGIAAFGPIDIDPLSATYGVVRRTPKPGWSGFDYRSAVSTFTDARCERGRPWRDDVRSGDWLDDVSLPHSRHRNRWWHDG